RESFFFSSRRRHTRSKRDWSSDVCSSDLSSPGAHDMGMYSSPTNRSRTPTSVDSRVQAGKGCGISQDRVEVRRVVVLESPHEGTLLSTYRVCRRRPGWGTTSLVSAGPWGGQGL